MTNRAPIYCDIGEPLQVVFLSLERPLTLLDLTATHIQVAQNVAIPASSLCINRRLYKIATAKAAKATKADKRRAIIQDLLIGAGIPVLQLIAREHLAIYHHCDKLFTRMQLRVHCFVESIRHNRGLRPSFHYRIHAVISHSLFIMANCDRYGIFLLLW